MITRKDLTISESDIRSAAIVHDGCGEPKDWIINNLSEEHAEQILKLAIVGLRYLDMEWTKRDRKLNE